MRIHKLILFLFSLNLCYSQIVDLNAENADSTFAQYPIVMVNFYADWCHFCRALAPIYQQAAELLSESIKDKKLLLAKVDCVAQTQLAQKYNVNKYPTLKVFIYGHESKNEYRGERSPDSIFSFLQQLTLPQFTIIPATSHSYANPQDKVVFHAILKSDKSPNHLPFVQVSSIMSPNAVFFLSFDPQAEEEIRLMEHSVIKSSLKFVQKPIQYLIDWVKDGSIQFVRELTFVNAEEITEEGKPLVVFFYPPNDPTSKKTFTEVVSSNLKDILTVNFVTADGNTFLHPLKHLAKSISDLPLIVIDSFQHMYLYKQPISEVFTNPELLRTFVNDLDSGKLHREYHYGPDPTQTSAPKESIFKELAPNENRYSLKDEF